jgi:hypothetical protein
MVVEWYRDHGYDFFSLSDHNAVSQGEKWVKAADVEKKMGEANFRRYSRRYDVPVRGEGALQQLRLRTWEEMQARFERPGRFLLIEAEEISDKFENRSIHLNAINLAELSKPAHGTSKRQVIADNLRAVTEQAQRLKRPILTTINHPNFEYALTAEDLAAAVDGRFVEVYNGHPSVHHMGDAEHLGVERMWDIANTARVKKGVRPLWGTACDDSHSYYPDELEKASPGRGWVMVRAENLSIPAILAAMERGDFYASSGVTLEEVHFDRQTDELVIHIEKDGRAEFTTQFIGSMVGSEQAGVVLATVKGREARYKFTGRELYVRATITSSKAAGNPAYEGQKRQAWTQPVGWEAQVAGR